MISLVNAGKRFGHKVLFEGLNWLLTPQDRVGLVGANGTGKTTLLRMLAGFDQADTGEITRQRGLRVGYLPQDGLSLSGRTVFNECLSVFDEQKEMEREMEQLAHLMADAPPGSEEYRLAAERYAVLDSQFRNLDGYSLEAKVGAVLTGLGFPKEDWTRYTEHFSGGWQMRIALARLLLQQPGLLLLDEPTNHLDLEARNWLEEYLAGYPFAYVVVSHDRYFLDVTVRRIAELWNRGMHVYAGNYEKYLKQKTERREQLEAAYRNQRERIEQLEMFINRFRAKATKAKQVQSRIKELEKIERIEIPPMEKTIHFSFPQPKPSGRIVAEFKGVSKSYGPKLVLGDVNFAIERHDRVALAGVNGAGKSTLIKLLAGAEPLTAGEYTLGYNAMPDYFAQDQYKELDPGARLLDDLMNVANGKTVTELRSLLGCFLFSEDDVYKPIGVLSGGERNRYALARLLLNPSNFLLLDEPTNHLDMRAKDVLLSALEEFTGTVVFVSHDRYFIDKLATRVFEIEGGRVQVYPGNYEDYLYRKAGGPPPAPEPALDGEPDFSTAAAADNGATPAAARRVNPIRVQKLKRRVSELEGAAAALEAEIRELESALQNFVSAAETQRQGQLLERKREQLAEALAAWETASLELGEAT